MKLTCILLGAMTILLSYGLYLRLGGQYAKSGQQEDARAAWQQGMHYFPDSAELKNRLSGQQ